MNVKEILTKYLKENGYDGLSNTSVFCFCGLEDLIPCVSCIENCKPVKFKEEEINGNA